MLLHAARASVFSDHPMPSLELYKDGCLSLCMRDTHGLKRQTGNGLLATRMGVKSDLNLSQSVVQ
eukprot:12413379-Karenia_brevis.AAC.1